MIDIFEPLIEAGSPEDDRPMTHACFDPIEPDGGIDVSAFAIESLIAGLRQALK